MDAPSNSQTHLTWANVGLGFIFIVFDAIISTSLGLGVGRSLVTAALRCMVQLSLMALVLQKIFEAKNPWGVAGLACECSKCAILMINTRLLEITIAKSILR